MDRIFFLAEAPPVSICDFPPIFYTIEKEKLMSAFHKTAIYINPQQSSNQQAKYVLIDEPSTLKTGFIECFLLT